MGDAGLLILRRDNTLTSLVAEHIEDLIVEGTLVAGERINEVALARELGVSRGPVREACRLVASKGLVEIVANKGAYVRKISRADLLEIYDLRAVLTGHACQLAAANPKRSMTELEALYARMAEAIGGDTGAYYALNLEFHTRLIEMADNTRLSAMTDGLTKEAHLFRQVSLRRLPDMTQSNAEHRLILDAIARGDEGAARQHGEDHVRAGMRRFEATAEPLMEREG